ncbi:ferritin-like protein [Actinomadura sp. LOL_016]|uniref:ferritin-like domain-containing protein n=1 Tax=unclassified Actinomadura TaxID=2626254 RepID=UPI003A812A8A
MITAMALHSAGFKIPESVPELRTYLQAALEVEHLTIPVYMTGLYTIRSGTNRPAHFAIRSVVLEEMLHMTLAANLLNAVGGHPDAAHPEFVAEYPARLPFSSGTIPAIGLQHFSPDALRTFLRIERPGSLLPDPDDASGWTSIRQFYDAIRRGLVALVEEHGPAEVFTGPAGNQVGPEDFYNSGGEAFAVTGLPSALKAIEVISDQGEGSDETIFTSDDRIFGEQRQIAHYFRFNEIYTGREYGPHDLPSTPPSGPLLDVTWDDAHPIRGDSKVADYREFAGTSAVYREAVEFNACYARLLGYLHSAFNGHPRHMALAVPTMLELRDRAHRMYRNPHPDARFADRGYCASLTFELEQSHFDEARELVRRHIDAAELRTNEPVDLGSLSAAPGRSFA